MIGRCRCDVDGTMTVTVLAVGGSVIWLLSFVVSVILTIRAAIRTPQTLVRATQLGTGILVGLTCLGIVTGFAHRLPGSAFVHVYVGHMAALLLMPMWP